MMPIATQLENRSHLDPPGPARSAPATTGRHLASIHALCQESGRPFDEMAALYYSELARLSARATIADYLPVLLVKHVRQHYRQRREAHAPGDPQAGPLDWAGH